ncbi:carboxypeptidase-like regulatory domain-containing protein [uncultured Bacteroides sp.]|uniref:carboxypeptidase-like regulatory domain-containing protein n=1 Tax=uncultured Bacteroides sp. TaxID=162156 RepID=UPI002AA635B4|nr:carboxypeptidase-like regulatory domain-containing protein [uncultured Bacteroides sp.]
MLLVIISIVFFNIFTLNSQTKGSVFDGKTNHTLVGANIYMQKEAIGLGTTDKNGTFDLPGLDKFSANDTIIFSYIGYQQVKCTLRDLKHSGYRVFMYELPYRLGEVAVTAERGILFLNYTPLSSLPKPLYSFGSFLSGGKIYVIAGDETNIKLVIGKTKMGTEAWKYHSTDMYVYDIANDSWTKDKQKFTPRACHTAYLYNDKIFVLGGKIYSANRKIEYTDATMEVYDMDKDTLYVDPVNPHQAVNFTSFIYNDYLYVMGGSVKEKVFSDKIHALDLKKGIWYDMGTIPKEKCREMNGIVKGHSVYFFGGSRTAPMWGIESYDLSVGEWKHLRDLHEGVSYPGLATNGNLIYIYENRNLQVYNVDDNSLRIYSIALNLENAGLFYFEDKLYIVGGCIRNGIYVSPSDEVYSIDVNQIGIE